MREKLYENFVIIKSFCRFPLEPQKVTTEIVILYYPPQKRKRWLCDYFSRKWKQEFYTHRHYTKKRKIRESWENRIPMKTKPLQFSSTTVKNTEWKALFARTFRSLFQWTAIICGEQIIKYKAMQKPDLASRVMLSTKVFWSATLYLVKSKWIAFAKYLTTFRE